MISTDLSNEVRRAWLGYGEAIVSAFGFPKGSAIVADGLETRLQTMTESEARRFIENVHKQAAELRSAKFVGDPD